jgi:predicted alpha/beta hydrolase
MHTNIRNQTIQAIDGFALAATVYEPSIGHESVAIVNAATAVPRNFYADYANHLCQAGHTVIIYDYRGIGESRPANLKKFPAMMHDWAELDMAGVIEWANIFYRPRHILLIGHSIGGQAAGLLNNSDKISAMVTISAQSGYWALVPSPEKYRIWFVVHFLIPILCWIYGYLPWSRLARGEDLPKGVALEWANWCRSKDYLFGSKTLDSLRNFRKFTAPILAYSFSDDAWATRQSVDKMMAHYTQAVVERRHRAPHDVNGNKIGHIGFFRPPAHALWQEVDEWIQNQYTMLPNV